jgi:predicted phosphodiesterase
MRVALISDLHANAVALAAVLEDIERVGVDQIICLGDVATLGPRPDVVLDTLRQLGCLCILGNHDEFMLDAQLIHTYTEAPVVVDAVDWCRARLSLSDLDFIRTFKKTSELALDRNAKLFLFHGSPRSNMEDLLATTPVDELDEMLCGHRATVMSGGHTHIQMMRQHRGTMVVNPGSVGLPFKEYVAGRAPTLLDHAEYATVEAADGGVSVQLRRVAVDRAALHDAVKDSDNPLRNMLLQHYA